MAKQEESGLLKVLNDRWKAFVRDLPDAYRVPVQDPVMVEKATAEYVQWNNTDPYAAARMQLHLKRGIELASDVYDKYHKRNLVRERNRRLNMERNMAALANMLR